MPRNILEATLTFASGQTIVQTDPAHPDVVLLFNTVVTSGAGSPGTGTGEVTVSPDTGNRLENRPNGLFVGDPKLASANW